MVLQLDAGAVGRGVDVDCDGVHLHLGLLGHTGGAETVQTESWRRNFIRMSEEKTLLIMFD